MQVVDTVTEGHFAKCEGSNRHFGIFIFRNSLKVTNSRSFRDIGVFLSRVKKMGFRYIIFTRLELSVSLYSSHSSERSCRSSRPSVVSLLVSRYIGGRDAHGADELSSAIFYNISSLPSRLARILFASLFGIFSCLRFFCFPSEKKERPRGMLHVAAGLFSSFVSSRALKESSCISDSNSRKDGSTACPKAAAS